MPHPAYSRQHKRIRAALMRQVERFPGKIPCCICGGPLYPPSGSSRNRDGIDLAHRSNADKQAGRPGMALAHAKCNRGEYMRNKHTRDAIAQRQQPTVNDWIAQAGTRTPVTQLETIPPDPDRWVW